LLDCSCPNHTRAGLVTGKVDAGLCDCPQVEGVRSICNVSCTGGHVGCYVEPGPVQWPLLLCHGLGKESDIWADLGTEADGEGCLEVAPRPGLQDRSGESRQMKASGLTEVGEKRLSTHGFPQVCCKCEAGAWRDGMIGRGGTSA
jgi:hypothetical protein